MRDLIGWECSCEFNLPSPEWPINGFPAWVVVEDVDMPMVKMRSRFSGLAIWVNASIIKTIRRDRKYQPLPLQDASLRRIFKRPRWI